VRYLTMMSDYQVAQVRDSSASGLSNDGCSPSVWRASADRSSTGLPIEFCNLALPGTGTAVYDVKMVNNAASLRASPLSGQPILSNDGFIAASIRISIAWKRTLLDALLAYGTGLIWNIPACTSLGPDTLKNDAYKALRHSPLTAGSCVKRPRSMRRLLSTIWRRRRCGIMRLSNATIIRTRPPRGLSLGPLP
jgi:hypothetical protein